MDIRTQGMTWWRVSSVSLLFASYIPNLGLYKLANRTSLNCRGKKKNLHMPLLSLKDQLKCSLARSTVFRLYHCNLAKYHRKLIHHSCQCQIKMNEEPSLPPLQGYNKIPQHHCWAGVREGQIRSQDFHSCYQ